MGEDQAERIEAAAVRQKRATFALVLADLLHCDSLSARRLVEDESGDALALAFIAIGLPQENAARIFLIAFPRIALSTERFDRVMNLFPSLPRRVASRIIEAATGARLTESALQSRHAPRTAMGAAQSAQKRGETAPPLRDTSRNSA
jgi:hypothetical protein